MSVIVFEILAFKVAYCVAERAVKKKTWRWAVLFLGKLGGERVNISRTCV